MGMNNLEGNKTIDANGTFLLCRQPFPVCGTLAVGFDFSSFVGDILPKVATRNAQNPVLKPTTYQIYGTAGTISAATPIAATSEILVRQDGVDIWIVVTNYASGSFYVDWAWNRG